MTGSEKTSWGDRLLILAAVAVLVAGSAYDFVFSTQSTGGITEARVATSSSTSNSSTAEYVTGASVTESDTLFTASCLPSSAGGGFQFRVVSDSAGQPVSGETVNAGQPWLVLQPNNF